MARRCCSSETASPTAGAGAPLGAGYVRAFTELATSRWPERDVAWINKGIGGNNVSDLRERWRDDVLFHKPDRLSIKIGINDLHSSLNGAEGGVDPARFEKLYDEILDITHSELGCSVVLLSPFYISTDTSGETNRSRVLNLLPQYIEVVSKMSDRYDTLMVPLHDVFQEQLAHRDAESFCPEPVHPNHAGHTIIAENLLEVLTEAG